MARTGAGGTMLTDASPPPGNKAPPPRDTFWTRLTHGIWRVRQQAHWVEFAGPDWIDHIMDLPAAKDFHAKQGRSTGQIVLQTNGRQLAVYLKRHYRLPLLDGLLALLRPGKPRSPALQEWENLEAARREGLPVPVPVAAGEFIGPWGRLQSFLAVKELTGMLALHQAIPAAAAALDSGTFSKWKDGLIAELVRLTRELHRRRWFHNDLYLCHFFVATEDTQSCPPTWRGRVAMIDLHRLCRNPWTPLFPRAKDLGQLLYSSDLPGVSARDRLDFWRQYVHGENLGWLQRRLLRWMIRIKAWVYHRNHRRKLRNV